MSQLCLRRPVSDSTVEHRTDTSYPRPPPTPAMQERPTRATRAQLASSAAEFDSAARPAIDSAAADGTPTSLLAVKLDGGAAASGGSDNGHSAALREQVVELIRRNLRSNDVVAHAAADEVLVLLPGAALDEGNHIASRLCAAIRSHAFAGSAADRPRTGVTASMGVASAPNHGTSIGAIEGAARSACKMVSATGGDGWAMAAARPEERAARGLDIGRFVGRTEELTSLRRWLDEAIAGSPRAVAVIGEAGSGRGALLRQLEAEVRLRGGSLVIARARSGTVRTPYGIWSHVLQALRRLPDSPSRTWQELMNLDPGLSGT